VLPVFLAAALHGLMQLSPTASRRTYVAHQRSRIAQGFLGLVSSLKSLAGYRGVACRCLLGPPAGSYRALVSVVSSLKSLARSRGVVTLVGRSAGLRMCGKVGVWREIICNFDPLCSALQAIYTPPRRTTPMGFPSFQTARNSKTESRKWN
jgi:hypothetical protein